MTSDNNFQKKCGFCGESIPAGAGRCPYCGSILEVTFDNSYRINRDEVQAAGPETAVQDNAGQQAGMGADDNFTASEMHNAGQQASGADVYGSVPPEHNNGQQTGYTGQINNEYNPYKNGGYKPNYNYSNNIKEPLSNGMKVFLTVLFTILPGIGQLAGIIAAIVFMNSEGDSDRKSFGVALLVASLIMFVLSCIGCFVFVIAFSSNQLHY